MVRDSTDRPTDFGGGAIVRWSVPASNFRSLYETKTEEVELIMPERRELRITRTSSPRAGTPRPLLPHWTRNLAHQRWFRASPIFFVGTVITAAGTTTYKSDTVIFVGMVIMGLGIVSMWLAEAGKPKLLALPGPLAFIAGSVLTAMSMTINPSNPLLCSGMILTGIGTLVMWVALEGKWGLSAVLISILFTAGISIEAVSLTIVPSDLLIMVGMIATGIGAFAMWAYETSNDEEEEEETSE